MRLKLLAYLTKNGAHGDGAVPPISDMEVRRDFEAAVEAIGDVHIQVGDADGDHHVRVCGRDGAPSRALAYLSLVGVHGIRGSDKVIPDFVFGLREDKLRLFLRCLLTCDGMVAGLEPPGDPGHILYRTTSVRLARQLQHLFARFGIVAALVGPSSDTGGGAELAIAVKADVIRCIEQIGFLGDKAMQAARLHAQLYSFHGGGEQPGRLGPILFDAVLSIEASRVAKSYDLQVDRSSNFIANEFVTHNEPHRPY
jgi:intein/homing endonuclease